MVHTRGQPRFAEGDRVLCYEPDSTKAQVLYEAKVLEVVERRERNSGRRTIECLVHFQGWNASWDRYVAEEQILEYSETNRRLQRTLAEKFLPPGVVDRRRYSGADSQGSSCGGGGGSAAASETASGAESEEEPPAVSVHIDVPLPLRRKLDDDYYYVNKYHKLHQLPCATSVVQLLEAYVHHWHQSCRHSAGKNTKVKDAWWEPAVRSLNLCKEVVDGLRITFDHVLELQLLYAAEREQHARVFRVRSPEVGHDRGRHGSEHSDKTDEAAPRMRLRSRGQARESGSVDPAPSSEDDEPETKRRLFSTDSSASSRGASDLAAWSLLPPSELNRNPPLACTVYGATHLLRLIALLPELLLQMHLSERKLNLVVHHVTLLLGFLQDSGEHLFTRANYR